MLINIFVCKCTGNIIKAVFSSLWNVKYQLLWNDEMQNAKIFMGVFSSIRNVKIFMGG
jgi:hypothetical protein